MVHISTRRADASFPKLRVYTARDILDNSRNAPKSRDSLFSALKQAASIICHLEGESARKHKVADARNDIKDALLKETIGHGYEAKPAFDIAVKTYCVALLHDMNVDGNANDAIFHVAPIAKQIGGEFLDNFNDVVTAYKAVDSDFAVLNQRVNIMLLRIKADLKVTQIYLDGYNVNDKPAEEAYLAGTGARPGLYQFWSKVPTLG